MVTLNIADLDRFFDVVNKCNEPVELRSPDGQRADLRNNAFLQYVLGSTRQPNLTTHVQLNVHGDEDIMKILEFAVGDAR